MNPAPATRHEPGDAAIERLVRQLGSPEFTEREAASKALREHGESARCV